MLEGKELLEKAKLLSKQSEDEIARGCGYVGPSGRVLRKSFYRALIEAKGYKIGKVQGRAGNRRTSRGRQTEFKTKVHGNGNLLIGHAYTKKLGLEPGKEFKIDLKKESKTIYLIPLN
ncbi:MAG: AbrB family transcriptional regulator [Prochlorococcus marinus CUG1439]|uniref:AbrB family transcriptional regulator n=1 Tax=Prochlorococcus sp. MIT 1314 TaxID=3096220 RepID=UPI001B19D87A|nr:AbrB family transcriptional regulator [Prochlorococcus sp. MIT 1314]MCR8539767.1 AbrB family transcriptional regulator [Prochlorococcus marinus CUG1439]